jgi:deazaflavin-dependent oxidoreductase (nitroreductase family)
MSQSKKVIYMSVENSTAANKQPAKKSNSSQHIFAQSQAFFYRLPGGKLGGRYGGASSHPIWWLNLQATPQAEVEIGRQKLRVTAQQADPQEHQRLWPLLVNMYPYYAGYQKKTTREIPVVILQPMA